MHRLYHETSYTARRMGALTKLRHVPSLSIVLGHTGPDIGVECAVVWHATGTVRTRPELPMTTLRLRETA